MDKSEEILEIVTFLKNKMATKDDLDEVKNDLQGVKDDVQGVKNDLQNVKDELKRDIHGIINRLDNELDKRKALEVRVSKLENAS